MKSSIILCGGQSRRMGKDKGSLIIKDKPMIKYILSTLNNEIDEVIIVLNDNKRIDKYEPYILSQKNSCKGSLFGIIRLYIHFTMRSGLCQGTIHS